MKLAYKIWLENNGKAFGKGPFELIKRVEVTKSLHKAASQMGMSYSKALRSIGTIEKKIGFTLLERTAGGLSGGGSIVTPQAQDLIRRYEQLERDVEAVIEQIYQAHFGDFEPNKGEVGNI